MPSHDVPRVLRAARLLGERGRQLQQVLTVLAVCNAARKRDGAKRVSPQRRARDAEAVDRKYGVRRMDRLSERDFRKMFRVSKTRFDFLLDLITPHIVRNEVKGANSSAQPIKPKTRLAATLRWLAGGSYHDICELYSVSRASFYGKDGIIWPTIRALDQELKLSFPINDAAKLEEISEVFERDSRGLLKGCVGAVDGLLIRTRCPYKREHPRGKLFRNRKSAFGIIALGIADPNGKFLSFCADWSGSTHDATAWATSDLKAWIDEKRLEKDVSQMPSFFFSSFLSFTSSSLALPTQYFLIGDEAFPVGDQLLGPWGGRGREHGLGDDKDAFNFYLSASRVHVERAFGMLVRRWGILWRRFEFDYFRWPLVACVCAKLHNCCMDDLVESAGNHHGDVTRGKASPLVVLNDDAANEEELNQETHGSSTHRLRITNYIRENDIRRPAWAKNRSRAN